MLLKINFLWVYNLIHFLINAQFIDFFLNYAFEALPYLNLIDQQFILDFNYPTTVDDYHFSNDDLLSSFLQAHPLIVGVFSSIINQLQVCQYKLELNKEFILEFILFFQQFFIQDYLHILVCQHKLAYLNKQVYQHKLFFPQFKAQLSKLEFFFLLKQFFKLFSQVQGCT